MADPPRSVVQDAARLEALDRYDLLDSAAEPEFDDIVALARALCDAPIALISFVAADRQWFKARNGTEMSETPVKASVCAHAIAQRSLLVIRDLREDARTADNPLVTGDPHLQFYAGAPIETSDGHMLGTVCVIDLAARPQGLTPAQVEGLQALARQTMKLIELRKLVDGQELALTRARKVSRAVFDRARASEAAGERLRQEMARSIAAQEAGRIGTFDIDLDTDLLRTSPQMCRLYGLPEAPAYPAEIFEPLAVAEDRHLRSTRETRRDGTAAPEVEYRIRRKNDGAIRWISRRGEFIRDEAGRAINFVGSLHDVTERRLAELRQAAHLKLADATRDSISTAEVVESAARLLGEAFDATRVGYAEIDLAAGTLVVERDWTAPGTTSIVGRYALATNNPVIVRLRKGEIVVADRAEEVDWLFADTPRHLVTGTQAQIKVPVTRRGALVGVLFVHSQQARRWMKEELEFVASLADRTYAALARVQAERDQRLLNEELSHRLKNNLAMVQAIAKQTLKSAVDRPAVEALNRRLVALGTAHDVLLRQSWKAADIRHVVESALDLHADSFRFKVNGDGLAIGAKSVLSLSMLLHELATNALKYGSLSSEHGTVAVSWTADADETGELTLVWEETGGPQVTPPTRSGFGSRLIRLGLAGTGDTILRYEPTGFKATFHAPLRMVTGN